MSVDRRGARLQPDPRGVGGLGNAAVAIHGPGTTIDGNLSNGGVNPEDNGDGIDIRMSGNTNGSILISGVTSIDNNAADGIHIEMTNVLNGALEINGPTTINNSGDDAIDITLTGTNLVNGLTFPVLVPPVQFLTLGSSLPAPLNFCLPLPVDLDLATIGVVPLNAFTINAITADASVGRGINIRGVNSTIAPNLFTAAANDNGMAITNNVVTNTQAGDGLHIDFNGVTGPGGAALVGVTIDSNTFELNSANGINFDLVNSPMDQLTITNNTGGGGGGNLVGATVLFGDFGNDQSVLNTSAAGISITSVLIDLTAPDFFYDSIDPGVAFPFNPDAGIVGDTGSTGLTSIDGQPVMPGVVPLANLVGVPYPGGGKIDDSHTLALTFNSFDTGETFDWDIDMDTDSQTAGFISGIDVAVNPGGDPTWTGPGTATITFSTGDVITQPFTPIVGTQSSNVLIVPAAPAGSGIANNGLDGIRFSLNNSTLSNMLVDTNNISSNGNPLVGHGVNFQSVVNSDITNALVSNNTIDTNAGDGFRLINPNTAGAAIDLTFRDNTSISTNTGAGINVQMNNAEVLNLNIESLATGNVISGNTSFGVHAVGLNNSTINLFVGDDVPGGTGAANLLSGNGDAGIGLDLRDNSINTKSPFRK